MFAEPSVSPTKNEGKIGYLQALRSMDLSDVVLFFYVAVLVRQVFWSIGNGAAEWISTVIVACAVIWLFSFRRRPETADKLPLPFWLIAALPITFVFFLRVSIPDTSYDVLNYHLVYAERTLNEAQFNEGDFFPFILSLNPAADTLTGLFRYALGYRLGTIVNLVALLWAAAILYRMLGAYIGNERWRAVAVVAIASTEQILFQLDSYQVDLLTVPLILEATRRIIEINDDDSETIYDVIFTAFLLGASCAFKLTNLAFVIPLGGIYFYRLIFSKTRPLHYALLRTLIFAAAFSLPLLPHAIYIYSYTGSPFFPTYNQIFRSPYFPAYNMRDQRFGTESFLEAISYPILTFVRPERLVEFNFYSGRIAIGAAAALMLLLVRRDKRIFRLALVTLAAGFLWSYSTGYIRYALPLEIYGGLCACYLLSQFATQDLKLPPAIRFVSIATIGIVFGTQIFLAYRYVLPGEEGWSHRMHLVGWEKEGRAEFRHLLRDYSLWKFQPTDNQKLFGQVDAWIIASMKTAGVEVLLNNNVPMLNVYSPEFLHKDHYATDLARELFQQKLSLVKARRMYSLCYAGQIAETTNAIARAGLGVGSIKLLRVPFYSNALAFDMALIEVLPSAPQPALSQDNIIPVLQ